jgi:site-specific DNA-methyltransferase (adenine-specific)
MDVLRMLADSSVDSIVTDPPYHLTQASRGGHARTNNPEMPHGRHRIGDKGFMGKVWDGGDIAHRVEMWAECLRVLKPGGHLLAFAGSRTYHRMAVAIEDAGFEIRDQIMWIYGSGFPKSKNLDGQWQGWGSALKPSHEPICMARKPLIGTISANVDTHGTGAINIDACRVHADDAIGGEYTVKRFAPGASVVKDGNWKQDVEFRGEMKAGRWPANVIHDGSPEVLDRFPDAPGQMADASLTAPSAKTSNVYGAMQRVGEASQGARYTDAGGTNFAMKPGARRLDTGSAARFFYCAKASRADRNEGVGGSDTPAVETEATMRDRETADWQERNGNHHPTVKPTDLMAYLCRLVTPPGGTVLDPFMGSGSTGKAAMREGFHFVGIDMTPEYVDIARDRIAHEYSIVQQAEIDAARQPALFEDAA